MQRSRKTSLCGLAAVLSLLPLVACLAPGDERSLVELVAGKEATNGTAGQESATSSAEANYKLAVEIRDSGNPSQKDLRRAVKLLFETAGIEHLSVEPTKKPAAKQRTSWSTSEGVQTGGASSNLTAANLMDHGYITADAVDLRWRDGRIAHRGAARELIFVFRQGDGAPYNPAVAHALLRALADDGDAEAQADLAFYLATGLEPVASNTRGDAFVLVRPDVPAALTLYYFAAQAGDPVAQMVLGYRHFHGIGVPRSCRTAALYYAPVAEKVLELARQPDSLPSFQQQFRLSHSSSGPHAKPRPSPEQELMHYQWFADYGHADAARAVAQLLHREGGDPEEAVRYLRQAAAAGDASAMVHLGHVYANGLVVDQDNATSWRWFWRAAELGSPGGFYGLGYMHLTGQGAEVDHRQALHYFRQAVEAGQGWGGMGDALFYLGMMHLKGLGTAEDISQANTFFTAASQAGNLLAAYNLAVLALEGKTGEPANSLAACQAAVAQLKRVAERGWPALAEASDDYLAGEYSWALLNYLKAAEWGSELAQSNAAFMLNEGTGYDGPRAGSLAMTLLRRSADQGNAVALLRIGDCYWYGRGVQRDIRRAATVYGEAARRKVPQALFTMGFLHQFGAGVARDHHLAKRYYDRVAATAANGRLAATLALAGLRAHGWYDSVRPSLPRAWTGLIDGVLSQATALTEREEPTKHAKTGMRRWLNVNALLDSLDAMDDGLDAQLLIWLGGLLGLVLWRRQMLRARQGQQEHRGRRMEGGRAPPPPPVAAAAAAAAAEQRPPQRQQGDGSPTGNGMEGSSREGTSASAAERSSVPGNDEGTP